VDALLKGVKTKPPEGLILPVLSASITGALNDNTDQVLYCLRVFPFIRGTLLENVSPMSFKKNLVWIQLSILYLYFGLQQWKVHDKYFLSLVDPNKSNFIISPDGRTLNMVDYGCLHLVTDQKPRFDCVTYVSILCGGTTSLPVVIPTDLTPDTNKLMRIAEQLEAISFVDEGTVTQTTTTTTTNTTTSVNGAPLPKPLLAKEIRQFNEVGNIQLPALRSKTSTLELASFLCEVCVTNISTWKASILKNQLYSAKTFKSDLKKSKTNTVWQMFNREQPPGSLAEFIKI